MDTQQILARELLQLESAYQQRELSPDEENRWQAIVGELFTPSATPRARRSFRLPLEIRGRVKIREGTFPCTFSNVSRLGMKVSSPVLAHVSADEHVELLSMSVDGSEHPVHMDAHLTWISATQNEKPEAGLVFDAQNSMEDRGQYFDRVYYPLYLDYLRAVAQQRS